MYMSYRNENKWDFNQFGKVSRAYPVAHSVMWLVTETAEVSHVTGQFVWQTLTVSHFIKWQHEFRYYVSIIFIYRSVLSCNKFIDATQSSSLVTRAVSSSTAELTTNKIS